MADYTPISPDLTAEELQRAVECLVSYTQVSDRMELTEQDRLWLKDNRIAS